MIACIGGVLKNVSSSKMRAGFVIAALLLACGVDIWRGSLYLHAPGNYYAEQRLKIEKDLSQNGRHLVFVDYEKNHTIAYEWVENSADIDDQNIIWVHDRGSENALLMHRYPERKAWKVIVAKDSVRLTPYP